MSYPIDFLVTLEGSIAFDDNFQIFSIFLCLILIWKLFAVTSFDLFDFSPTDITPASEEDAV